MRLERDPRKTPLEITANKSPIAQPRTPCTTHKHSYETARGIRVPAGGQRGAQREKGGQCTDSPCRSWICAGGGGGGRWRASVPDFTGSAGQRKGGPRRGHETPQPGLTLAPGGAHRTSHRPPRPGREGGEGAGVRFPAHNQPRLWDPRSRQQIPERGAQTGHRHPAAQCRKAEAGTAHVAAVREGGEQRPGSLPPPLPALCSSHLLLPSAVSVG